MYILGIDGGGSKTRCILGDSKGNILADVSAGPSNHQVCGPEETRQVVKGLMDQALSQACLDRSKISYAFLGLAGADLAEDFEMLYSLLDPVFDGIPYKIVNDVWLVMRSGTSKPWGAVCICGTGSNSAAANPDGQEAKLRSLGYELGNYGGGTDMGREALYRAFRADEGTGPETSLTDHLPKIFGKDSMADLVSAFYPSWGPDTYQRLKKVPPLVFKLASEGDQVCQDILIHMGSVLGEMTRGVIREVGMENMDFHIVLGGSLFYGENPLFIDAFTLAVHRAAPKATIRLARLAPVVGAYLYSLDALGIETDKAIIENLRKSPGLE